MRSSCCGLVISSNRSRSLNNSLILIPTVIPRFPPCCVCSCCDPRQRDERRGTVPPDPHMHQRVGRSNSMTSVATLGEQGARSEEGGIEQGRSVTPNDISDGGELLPFVILFVKKIKRFQTKIPPCVKLFPIRPCLCQLIVIISIVCYTSNFNLQL